jgi:hypothetical protein
MCRKTPLPSKKMADLRSLANILHKKNQWLFSGIVETQMLECNGNAAKTLQSTEVHDSS